MTEKEIKKIISICMGGVKTFAEMPPKQQTPEWLFSTILGCFVLYLPDGHEIIDYIVKHNLFEQEEQEGVIYGNTN